MDEELSKKTAKAMTSARPCDSCGARRACWFCAADAAYLCHACDTSVHTVNSLACRHNRLRLKLSAVRYHGGLLMVDGETSWPRKKTRSEWRRHNITLAPSLQSTESGCCTGSSKQNPDEAASTGGDPQLLLNSDSDLFRHEAVEDLNLASFRSRGSHGNDYLEMMSNNNENCEGSSSRGNGQPPLFIWPFDRVKIEESDDAGIEAEAGPEELFDLNIDLFDLTANFKDADHRMKVENCSYFNDEERKICLSLNYEDVLSAWSDRRSPWADPDDIKSSEGTRGTAYGVVPDLNLRSESCGDQIEEVPVMAAHDYDGERKYKSCGGREARVMRYREKRRRRLFSKRIRYHVRKLYAEKRQRMKGRFVKSACAGEVSLD